MDYRTLLKRYIQYIRDIEGTDYIEGYAERTLSATVTFTLAELAALDALSLEVIADVGTLPAKEQHPL